MLKSYVYFPEELDEKIKAAAKEKGKSKAWIIRDAVAQTYQVTVKAEKKDKKEKFDLAKAFSGTKGMITKYEKPNDPVGLEDWDLLK